MIFKKILWTIKRHPYLYIARFKLLSKNSNIDDIAAENYNRINKAEDIPDCFREINTSIFASDQDFTDLQRVKHLSIWLHDNIKGGPGLSEPSDRALQIMLEGKGGVCSDMAQIFNNFCVINNIQVREWGTTRAPFNKDYGGHSFNEVFCKELDKWVLIDVYSNVLFYGSDKAPLSVIDMYHLLRNDKPVTFECFNANRTVDAATLQRNYFDPHTVPFLICNYSNKTYDKVLRHSRPFLPVFMSHFIVFVFGKSYYYRFPLDNYKKIFS